MTAETAVRTGNTVKRIPFNFKITAETAKSTRTNRNPPKGCRVTEPTRQNTYPASRHSQAKTLSRVVNCLTFGAAGPPGPESLCFRNSYSALFQFVVPSVFPPINTIITGYLYIPKYPPHGSQAPGKSHQA